MPLNPTYETLMQEWEAELDGLAAKVFQSLKQAFPNGRTRRELIKDVYGISIPETADLNNNHMDRKIRLTIAKLFQRLIPVMSSSGKAGYRLDLSEETIRKVVGEWTRRRNEYDSKIRRGEQLILKIKQVGELAMPVKVSRPAIVTQLNFMESSNG